MVKFMLHWKFPDEEDVEEETRIHKSLYFGQKPNAASRTPKKEAVRDGASNADDIDMSDDEKPISTVNFLFSNDMDLDEAIDDSEQLVDGLDK